MELRYEQNLTCDRCLEPAALPAAVNVALILKEGSAARTESHLDDAGDPEDAYVVYLDQETTEHFDTHPYILEAVELHHPMKPVCRPDCKGLCPDCGISKNDGDCSCREDTSDPRWKALAELRGQLE